MLTRARKHRRWATAAVETALVMLPMTMVLFGVFEYGRLLMVWNLVNNAAREGCRYALVNNTAATITTDVTNIVTARMGTQTASFTTFTITLAGSHNGTATAINNLVPGDLITVTITGQYKAMNVIPVVPLPAITITSGVTMVCEGGT